MSKWLAVATLVSTDPAISQGWCTPFGCVSQAVLSQLLLLIGVTALACFALAALSVIPEARVVVNKEHSRTAGERDAFDRFQQRIQALETTHPRLSDGGQPLAAGTLSTPPPSDGQLATVKKAYRETVMDMEHYSEEYDESLERNLSAEFGEGIARAVECGSVLTPALRNTLHESAVDAKQRRSRLCHALDTEDESLQTAATTLRDIEQLTTEAEGSTLGDSFETLDARWDRLSRAQHRTEQLLTDQQVELHDRHSVAPRLGGPISLHEYLYSNEPYTHPVLAEATALLDSVHTAQRRTAIALSRRV
jgi:hypothetical protein